MYTVFLHQLEVYAFHGVTPEERKIGHRYSISVELFVNGVADQTDKITDTVDYGELATSLRSFCMETQYATLEHLAKKMGQLVLERHARVVEVDISVEKRLPPMDVVAESAGVRLKVVR